MDIFWESHSSMLLTEPKTLQQQLNEIELAARACYRSENKYNEQETTAFIRRLLDRGHESPIEFSNMHVIFRTSRGIANEVVRHRLFSFCQESTRYVNYESLGYIPMIVPTWAFDCTDSGKFNIFKDACLSAVNAYARLIENGCTPQQAREVLPQATATTLHVSGNFREWRHFFKLRTSSAAHPDMQYLANGLLRQVLEIDGLDVIFGEFSPNKDAK